MSDADRRTEAEPPAPIERARAAARRERAVLVAERDAFDRFRALVAELNATTGTAPRATALGGAAAGEAPAAVLDRVREAYERTVMAVPHYDAEYGDDYRQSVVAEFGSEVAAALAGGRTFTRRVRGAVAAAAAEARRERADLLSVLEDEVASLDAAATALSEVDERLERLGGRSLDGYGFEDLRRLHDRLGDLRADLDAVAHERQSRFCAYRRAIGGDSRLLPRYLYEQEPFTFPVLAAVADRGTALSIARRRVRLALTTVA